MLAAELLEACFGLERRFENSHIFRTGITMIYLLVDNIANVWGDLEYHSGEINLYWIFTGMPKLRE
jgi:hypothetical protein